MNLAKTAHFWRPAFSISSPKLVLLYLFCSILFSMKLLSSLIGTLENRGVLSGATETGSSNTVMFHYPISTLDHSLRRQLINQLPEADRWTQEACVNHWARGIDKYALKNLAGKRILFALNLKNNEVGERPLNFFSRLEVRVLRIPAEKHLHVQFPAI